MRFRGRSRSLLDRLRRALCVLCCLVVVLLCAYIWRGAIWRQVVRALVVEDEIEEGDVIFVHGGALPMRFPFAVRLLQEGWSERVMVAGVPSEERYVRKVWEKEGLPPEALTVLRGSASTYDEAVAVHKAYAKEEFRRIIVVTDAIHSRRSRYCLEKVFSGEDVDFIFHPLRVDLDPDKHFRAEEDFVTYVLHEYLKLIYYRLHY